MVSPKYAFDFKASSDYAKINQIIQQYHQKYKKDLSSYANLKVPLLNLKEQLTTNIVILYEAIERDGEDL